MALTATAQSALPPTRGHAWDEVIVPTLRRRLKDESNMLAKRISAASIGSGDEHSSDYQFHPNSFVPPPVQHQKPSAIPRPSLQHTRAGTDSPQASPSPSQTYQRPRTYSQPFLFDELGAASTSGVSSRPTSPMVNGTRIPVSRGRTGSTSTASHAPGSIHGSVGRTESHGLGISEQPDLSPVDERSTHNYTTTRSTVRMPRIGGPQIFNEQAPFNSVRSADYDPPRISSDSEERPFEHWYRGDVSRNGGVGELRVGRRDEMLDIASYGHSFRDRKTPSRMGVNGYSRSRSNSRGRDTSSRIGSRQRADSVGARDSVYFEEQEGAMVFDEQPLTDFESDDYAEQEELYEMYQEPDVQPHPNGTISSPSLLPISDSSKRVSRIPTPSRHVSPPPRTPTPNGAVRSMSEASTSSNSAAPQSRRGSYTGTSPATHKAQTLAAPSTASSKRRARSPATPTSASASKRPKAKAPPSSMQKRSSRNEEHRRSIGQYPTPDGDDVVDAIPTFTQPVPASGNWDDVVLPAVARKKGLNGHYVTTDGSPKPKPISTVYEPAPGTFGYDHSKYRSPNSAVSPEDIPMDEFGQKKDELRVPEPQPSPSPHPTPQIFIPEPSYDNRPRMRPSPPPFAHYGDTINVPTSLHIAQFPEQRQDGKHDDDVGGGGCCKCVVM